MPITITKEMIKSAEEETNKRSPYIKHHFNLNYMSSEERDQISFLGEFACKQALGLDWKASIRDSYEILDSGDIISAKGNIDIKTETIPFKYLDKLIKGKYEDDKPTIWKKVN